MCMYDRHIDALIAFIMGLWTWSWDPSPSHYGTSTPEK
jgi:hypothetical protein